MKIQEKLQEMFRDLFDVSHEIWNHEIYKRKQTMYYEGKFLITPEFSGETETFRYAVCKKIQGMKNVLGGEYIFEKNIKDLEGVKKYLKKENKILDIRYPIR